jgi:DNA-binding PadR family transcriptional regulator
MSEISKILEGGGGPTIFSDYEIVNLVVKKHPNSTAREIANYTEEVGVRWDKGRVNSVLYKMQSQGLVHKSGQDGPRPRWSITEDTDIGNEKVTKTFKAISRNAKPEDFTPLTAITELTIEINGLLIQIAIDNSFSPNDLYVICDWLDQRIFCVINTQHPYIKSGTEGGSILTEFIRFAAMDAYCEWRLLGQKHLTRDFSFIRIKDQMLRALY